MRLKRTLALGIILLLALAVFWILSGAPREKSNAQRAFENFNYHDLDSVIIENQFGNFKLIRKKELEKGREVGTFFSKWELDGIPQSSVEEESVSKLLNAVRELSLERCFKPESEEESDAFGLSDPILKLSFSTQNGVTNHIDLGIRHQYFQRYYVRVNQQSEICFARDELVDAADRPASEFRRHALFDFVDSDLTGFGIWNVNTDWLRAVRASDRTWRIIEPRHLGVREDAVTTFTRQLRSSRVKEFHDEQSISPERYGLGKPFLRFELRGNGDFPQVFSLGLLSNADGREQTFLWVEGAYTVYEMEPGQLSYIRTDLDYYRARKLFEFATDDAVKVRFEYQSNSPVEISLGPKGWLVNGKPGDSVFIRQLLTNLSQLEATSFPAESDRGEFTNSRLKVIVSLKDASNTQSVHEQQLVIGASTTVDGSEEKRFYAKGNDPELPFFLSEQTVRRLEIREEALLASGR